MPPWRNDAVPTSRGGVTSDKSRSSSLSSTGVTPSSSGAAADSGAHSRELRVKRSCVGDSGDDVVENADTRERLAVCGVVLFENDPEDTDSRSSAAAAAVAPASNKLRDE
jgi:hypothetical protein